MATETQIYHTTRRRLERAITVAVARLLSAAVRQDRTVVQRAAEDLAQSVDEMLVLVGGHELQGSGQLLDCPDCGQYVPDALDILTEGEGE